MTSTDKWDRWQVIIGVLGLIVAIGSLIIGIYSIMPQITPSLEASNLSSNSYNSFNSPSAQNITQINDSDLNSNIKPLNIPKTFTSSSTGMEFLLIPSGKFILRSVHNIKIEEPFYLSKYEVTQKQWKAIMGSNPSEFVGDDLPVEQVSWEDAQEFIKKLNEIEDTNKYCLPSEAKWSYASSAGATTNFFFGDDESELDYYAWYDNNSGNTIHLVGQKNPNRWGLYDTCGNVWEWCQDIYHDDVNDNPSDGSAWESGSGRRILLGGCWNGEASLCQLTLLGFNVSTLRGNNIGFRVMKTI